jgi:hypothetical protein
MLRPGKSVEQFPFYCAEMIRPARGVGGNDMSLRSQDHSVVEHSQIVGTKGGTRRGDVNDELRQLCGWRALRSSQAFHCAITTDAMLGKESLGQIHILGRDANAPAMTTVEGHGQFFEVGHALHVGPPGRHGDHDVGVTESARCAQNQALIAIGNCLAQQIFASYSHVRGSVLQELSDF